MATSTRSRKGLAWEAVRKIGLTLPNTEETTAWNTPVLRVNGHIFAGIPVHKSAEPGSLMLSVSTGDRDLMIDEEPDVYYTAAHYENYPCVLVRLARVNRDVVEDLLRMSHRFVSAQHQRTRSARSRTGKRPSRSRRS